MRGGRYLYRAPRSASASVFVHDLRPKLPRRKYQNFVSAGYSSEQIQTKVSIRDFLMPVTITVQMVGRFSSFRDSRSVPTLRHPSTRRTLLLSTYMAMYCTVLTPNRDCFTEHAVKYLVPFRRVHAVEKDYDYLLMRPFTTDIPMHILELCQSASVCRDRLLAHIGCSVAYSPRHTSCSHTSSPLATHRYPTSYSSHDMAPGSSPGVGEAPRLPCATPTSRGGAVVYASHSFIALSLLGLGFGILPMYRGTFVVLLSIFGQTLCYSRALRSRTVFGACKKPVWLP